MRLTEGDLIGHYKVVSTIGAGAMGAVYRVFDTRLEVERALKIIKLPELADDAELAEYRARFYREARTIANLHVPIAHPNIIQVHDMGDLGGLPWFTMNAFPGMSLTEWMGMRPRPTPDQALRVMKQLASGLAHAHKRGVKHRDIKLGNALVSNDGEHAVLIDWGIAKSDNDQNLTMTGVMSGTEAYMAPEYLMAGYRGESLHTEQTDLWSLGVVFYALATGKRAFDASVQGYQKRIIDAEFVHPLEVRPDLDDDFVAVILDLLKKEPADRIQSAELLQRRLEGVKRTIDPAKPPFDSQNFAVPPAAAPAPKVQSVKVIQPDIPSSSAQQPTMNARSRPVEPRSATQGKMGGGDSAFDPFAAAEPAKKVASSDGLPLPPDPASVRDDLWGTQQSKPAPAPQPHAAQVQAQAAPAPASSASKSDGQTFLRALRIEDADDDAGVAGVAGTHVAASEQQQPSALPAAQTNVASPPEESVVRPVSFGEGAVALRAERGKMEARRALVLAVGAVGALVVTGFTVTSMFGGDDAPPPPSTYVDPNTVQQQRDAKAALAEIEREKAQQEEQARKVAIALEERRRAEAAAAAAAAATPPAPAEPAPSPSTPGVVAAKPPTGTVKRDAVAAAPAAPPSAEVSRYGNRQSGNTAAVGSQPAGSATATTTAAVQGVRIPARLKVQATSAPGPIIAVVTQETLVGSVRIPAGTEVHGQPSGASGSRLNITFSTALIGGKNVALRGIALGGDQRAGLIGSRSLGNGTDTAADVAGTVVGNAGNAIANATGLKPVADAVNAATGSAQDKTRRINSAEDVVVVPSSTRFFIYVEGI